MRDIPTEYKNLTFEDGFGYWKVEAISGSEGETTRQLGTYLGYIDEIAFALNEGRYWNLAFTPVSVKVSACKYFTTDVDVALRCSERDKKKLVKLVKNLCGNANISVTESNLYGCVRLERDIPKDVIKERALSKLTPEEKAVLGL